MIDERFSALGSKLRKRVEPLACWFIIACSISGILYGMRGLW